jgi:hypothetical protein
MNLVVIEKTNNIYAVVGLGSVSDPHRANLKSIFPASQVACLSSSGRSIKKMPSECYILSKSPAELISHDFQFAEFLYNKFNHAK